MGDLCGKDRTEFCYTKIQFRSAARMCGGGVPAHTFPYHLLLVVVYCHIKQMVDIV